MTPSIMPKHILITVMALAWKEGGGRGDVGSGGWLRALTCGYVLTGK